MTTAVVSFGAQKFDVTADAQTIRKGSLSDLDRLTSRFDRNEPVTLTVTMNEDYDVHDMERYLETLTGWPRFKLVAFLNQTGNFVGCASASGFYRLIQNYHLAHEFLQIVQRGNEHEIFRYPGILKNVIAPHASNAHALAIMDQYALDALAVVGDDHQVKGVIEREQLINKLVLSLIDDATGNR